MKLGCLLIILLFALTVHSHPVRDEIERLAEGVVFRSEGDSKLRAFEVNDACSLLPSEGLDFALFFQPVINRDGTDRWENLVNYMLSNLTNLKVYKVGKIQVDIYAVGCHGDSVIGLYFTAIET